MSGIGRDKVNANALLHWQIGCPCIVRSRPGGVLARHQVPTLLLALFVSVRTGRVRAGSLPSSSVRFYK